MKVTLDIVNKKIRGFLPKNSKKTSEDFEDGVYVIEIEEEGMWFEKEVNDKGKEIDMPKFRDLTNEELYPYLMLEWKKERQTLVDNIEIIYNGVVYQGDETSQDRMSRAINGLPDDTSVISWKAKDNSKQELTKLQLKEVLYLAGQEQTRIWFEDEPTIEG